MLSFSDTEATFELANLVEMSSRDVYMYWPIGLPANHSETIRAGYTLTPKFVSVSPRNGSLGGTLLTAQVPGLAFSYQGSIDLVDDNQQSICSSARLVRYGVVECMTNPGEIANGTNVTLKLGSDIYNCSALDSTQC